MQELLRTNDIVLLQVIGNLLEAENIPHFIADQYMSAMEGSVGFLPRRVMVAKDQLARARRLMDGAGLGAQLPDA